MDRVIEFYSRGLTFEKVSDVEVVGDAFEHLEAVFGARARVVRMKLGDEQIELTEYLAPRGRPIPVDSRSHDRWFQHVAIIVSDMDRAYAVLRAHRVQHASTGPQRLPDWDSRSGIGRPTGCSSASTIRRSSRAVRTRVSRSTATC
jgi:hypothetical protein